MIRRLTSVFLILAVAAVGAPADKAGKATDTKPPAGKAGVAVPSKADYILQPSDLLKVQIFQEDNLTREVRVSQEYTISLPLIGTVDVRNKSLNQAQALVRDLYDRDYLVNPQVNLSVMEYAKRTVLVLGSVGTPGAVVFPQEEGLVLLDAVARAGGFNRYADKKRVKLTRLHPDGRSETFEINADDILQGKSKETWPLLKDDVISVPERIL